MSQTSELLDTLKHCLKAKGMTYRQLAREMGLSETSIKRLFSKESVSLKRLEAVCRILDLDLYDLTMMSRKKHQQPNEVLTIEQERALAADTRLSIFFYFLLNGFSLSSISDKYDITKHEATGLLVRLDRLGLIELHADNRFRLLISKNVYWRKHGPLWKIFLERIKEDFFDFPFDIPNCRLEFSPGVLSEATIKIILKKIDTLVRQCNELAEMDTALPIDNRYSTGLIIGFRPWVFSMIADIKKKI